VSPSLRILLAEDNRVIQDLIRRVFERYGHSVTIANNGREAVTAVQYAAFDAVLMDIRMPEMDGIEAIAAIRAGEAGRRLPIIVMTADLLSSDRARCLEAGADGYAPKPVRPTTLLGVIRRCLDNAVPADPKSI